MRCEDHTDASVLTIIPKSVGCQGLEIKNPITGEWQKVEADLAENQCIVFPGDMMRRISNNLVQPTHHRVAINGRKERLSCPFELMLCPSAVVDVKKLFPNQKIAPDCCDVETSMSCMSILSQGRVSVNKTS